MHDNVLWFTSTPLPEYLREALARGELSRAEILIKNALASSTGLQKLKLEFELDKISRWRLEFPYTLEEAYEVLKKDVPDLKLEEMGELLAKGCIDSTVIDDEPRVLKRFAANAFWLCPDLKARRRRIVDERDRVARLALKSRAELVVNRGRSVGGGHVLPLQYRVRATLRLRKGAVPCGEEVRVWIPLPRVSGLHPEVRILRAEPKPKRIAAEDHQQRTVYFELPSEDGEVCCTLEYEFISRGFHVDVDPRNTGVDEGSDVYVEYTRERVPHMVFTPYLKELASRIVGDEKNPYFKVKRIWDWITRNIRYTYARDYALYDCIAEYVARERRGDCGMQAILFITLCRIAGVPARWESGWYTNPVRHGMHDWAQFYIEPYGWLYADPSFGSFRHGEEWRNSFYLGSIEGYRLASNIEVSTPFDPPKTHFRSDPVDSQRGEVEWSGGNLYYDKWDFDLEIMSVENLEADLE